MNLLKTTAVCIETKHLMFIKLVLKWPGKTGNWNTRNWRVLCDCHYAPSPNPTYIQIAAMGDLMRIMVKWLHNHATNTADLQIIGKWVSWGPGGVCMCVLAKEFVVWFISLIWTAWSIVHPSSNHLPRSRCKMGNGELPPNHMPHTHTHIAPLNLSLCDRPNE